MDGVRVDEWRQKRQCPLGLRTTCLGAEERRLIPFRGMEKAPEKAGGTAREVPGKEGEVSRKETRGNVS